MAAMEMVNIMAMGRQGRRKPPPPPRLYLGGTVELAVESP